MLKNIIDSIKEVTYTYLPMQKKLNKIQFFFYDIIYDKHKLFSMGRHSGTNLIFYLVNTYSKIPKQLIRDNANFLIIFKQDDKNVSHEHCSVDMGFVEFQQMYQHPIGNLLLTPIH